MKNYLHNIKFFLSGPRSCGSYIFVLGVPRSGTSLLKNILQSNSRLTGSVSESTGFFTFRDFNNYNLDEFCHEELVEIISGSDGLIQAYERVSKLYLSETQDQSFVDKVTPSRYRYLFLRNRFPNARFIHIVRDGRDAFCSARKHGGIKQAVTPKKFANYWCNSIRIVNECLPKEKIYTIRYEDMVAMPYDCMHGVMTFLGLPMEVQQLQREVYASKTNLYLTREYHQNLEKNISTKSIGKYKNNLTLEEQKVFLNEAEICLINYGYAPI